MDNGENEGKTRRDRLSSRRRRRLIATAANKLVGQTFVAAMNINDGFFSLISSRFSNGKYCLDKILTRAPH